MDLEAPLPVLLAVSWTTMRIPRAALKMTRCRRAFMVCSLVSVRCDGCAQGTPTGRRSSLAVPARFGGILGGRRPVSVNPCDPPTDNGRNSRTRLETDYLLRPRNAEGRTQARV